MSLIASRTFMPDWSVSEKKRPAVGDTAGLDFWFVRDRAKTRHQTRYWPTLTVTGAVLVLTPSETV